MEFTGTGYLFALSGVAMTFAGFSALILVLRQVRGSTVNARYDAWGAVMNLQSGFLVSAAALVPVLLADTGWFSLIAVWRAASLLLLIPLALSFATYMRRRRTVTGVAAPRHVILNLMFLSATMIPLAFNILGWPLAPQFGLYAAALTWFFILVLFSYQQLIFIVLHDGAARG